MVIDYVDKIELYQGGYFVDSFDNLFEIKEYIENKAKYEDEIMKRPLTVSDLNKMNYTIIQSKHLVFSGE